MLLELASGSSAQSLRNPEGFIVETAVPIAHGEHERELSLASVYEEAEADFGVAVGGAYAVGLDASEIEFHVEAVDDDYELGIEYLRSLVREELSRPEVALLIGAGAEEFFDSAEASAHLEALLLLRKGFFHGYLSADLNLGYVHAIEEAEEGGFQDGAVVAAGISIPPGSTFRRIPSRRASLDRRLFFMVRVRGMQDSFRDDYHSPGVQLGLRWINNPRGRTWNIALGADDERAPHMSRRSPVYRLAVTHTFSRGKRVKWGRGS